MRFLYGESLTALQILLQPQQTCYQNYNFIEF